MNHRPDDVGARPLSGRLAEVGLETLPLDLIAPEVETVGDPVYDEVRLASLEALGLSDPTRVQPLVDDILKDVAERLHAPIALLNVVLTNSQIVAGQHGLTGWLAEVRGTPIEWSLCARVVRTGESYVVPDWAEDEATSANPLHTVDGLRAYAGVPLVSPTGELLGAVCLLDTDARDFGAEVLDVLAEAASRAMDRLVETAPAPRSAERH